MKVEPTVAPGVGFWLKTPKTNADGETATEGLTFVVAGGVPGATTVARNGTAFVLASFPAPVDIAIDDSKITWNLNPVVCWDVESGASFVDDEWTQKTPQIQIPDGLGSYNTYYYVTKAWDDAAQDFTADGVGVWVDGDGMKVSAVAPAGVGVWFKVPNATDAGFGFSLSDVTK
jgi:hypothetical protein